MPTAVSTEHSVRARLGRVKEFAHQELLARWEGETKQLVLEFLETSMTAELEALLGPKGQHQPVRVNYFNGSYRRSLTSVGWGHLGALRVPRPRQRVTAPYRCFAAYQRRSAEFDRWILTGYLAGHSTAQASRFFRRFLGEDLALSPATVTRVLAKFNGLIAAFRRRPLGRYRVLWLDGLWLDVVEGVLAKKALLVVMGLTRDGRLEVLDFQLARSEGEGPWSQCLTRLIGRGLDPDAVQCVVHDGAGGLEAAIRLVFPHAQTQWCAFHRLLNLIAHLRAPRRHRRAITRQAWAIFAAPDDRTLRHRLTVFRAQWSVLEPRAVRLFCQDLDRSLTYRRFAPALWARLRTTNPLERFLEELRRRQRPLRYFQSLEACERLVTLLCLEFNHALEATLREANYTQFD
jgi:transposase-like protein